MSRAFIVCIFVAMLVARWSCAADKNALLANLDNADAKNSIREYESEVSKFRSDFTKGVASARKKLLAKLESAQTEATKANRLDEAVLIRDIKRSYASSPMAATPMTEIHIIAAFYGQNISWLDVTEKVRAATKGKTEWSTTVNTKDWGEPAPRFGAPRTLMIRYSVGGKVMFKATYQGSTLSLP